MNKNKSLVANCPQLVSEWHPELNGDKTPEDVFYGSSRYAWWICKEGHEYVAEIRNRANGKGCSYCNGKRVSPENSLYTKNKELSRQWHPFKNGNLTPLDFAALSGKIAWWSCEKGHEWQAVIGNRHRGRGCPMCVGRKAITTYDTSFEKAHYTVKDVMEILRVSNWELLESIKEGHIPANRFNRKYIFEKEVINRLVTESK